MCHDDDDGVDMGWHADRALILSRQQPICTAAMTHMCAPRHHHDDDDDDDEDDDDWKVGRLECSRDLIISPVSRHFHRAERRRREARRV